MILRIAKVGITGMAVLLLFVGMMIVIDPIGIGMVVTYKDDDRISLLLRKDVVHGVGMTTVQLMLYVLYLQHISHRILVASSLLTAYTISNLVVTLVCVPITICHEDCQTDILQSSILVLIPILCLCILILKRNKLRKQNRKQPASLVQSIRQVYDSNNRSICGKVSLLIYYIAVSFQIIMMGCILVITILNLDNYQMESKISHQARRLEGYNQSCFGFITTIAMLLVGPTSLSFTIIFMTNSIAVLQSWTNIYLPLLEANHPPNLVVDTVNHDFYTGLVTFECIAIILFIGLLLQIFEDQTKNRHTTTTIGILSEQKIPTAKIDTTFPAQGRKPF